MLKRLVQAMVIAALPAVVFFAAAAVMTQASHLQHVDQVVAETAAPPDRRPLHFRLGYGTDAASRYWAAVVADDVAFEAERRFLHLDLIFPLVYGTGLVTALLMAWRLLGRPFSRVWLIAPVVSPCSRTGRRTSYSSRNSGVTSKQAQVVCRMAGSAWRAAPR